MFSRDTYCGWQAQQAVEQTRSLNHVAIMKLHGSLSANLSAALVSMQRHRAHGVHPDTLAYWEELLAFARSRVRSGQASTEIAELLQRASLELAERMSSRQMN